MMAVRERAAAVMAALDRRFPNLDGFVGQSWSSWAERENVFVSDAKSDPEECGKNEKKKMDTMTLDKEDMSVFGQCPAHDDFCLVVCSHCGQVVKPQAFEKHCERRHGPLGILHGRLPPSFSSSSFSSSPAQRPRPPSAHGTSHPARAPSQTPQTAPHHRHAKSQEVVAGSSPSDRASQPPPPADSPPAPSLRDPPWPHGAPPAEKPLQRRAEAGCSASPPPSLRGPRANKKVSRKQCDLDKHCGVMDPEKASLCTRLLTCNIHSIHQRRKVLGRSKNFDQLVAELKMGFKVRGLWVGHKASRPAREPSGDQAEPPPGRREPDGSTAFSRSRTSSESAPEEDRVGPENQEAPPLSPPAQSRLSSAESDGEGQDEPPDWHSAPLHPKPLALCSFGSHAVGRGVFTFDRRLHHLRSALSVMVERHLNGHLWRKMSQATDAKSQCTSVRPTSVTATTDYNSQHSTVGTARGAGHHGTHSSCRTSSSNGVGKGVWPSPGAGCGPPRSTGGSRPIASPVPAQAPSPSPAGLARPRNPVGRPSKQQLRLRQAERQAAATSRKRRASPRPDGSPCRERNSAAPAPHGPGRQPVPPARPAPSPHGPINGSLSPRARAEPRSPSPGLLKRAPPVAPVRHSPDPASRGRGGDSGGRSMAVSYDHKGLGRKCRGPGPSPQKIHRLPSPSSHPSFFSWKKDGPAGGLSTGLERKLGMQKPKLHH